MPNLADIMKIPFFYTRLLKKVLLTHQAKVGGDFGTQKC